MQTPNDNYSWKQYTNELFEHIHKKLSKLHKYKAVQWEDCVPDKFEMLSDLKGDKDWNLCGFEPSSISRNLDEKMLKALLNKYISLLESTDEQESKAELGMLSNQIAEILPDLVSGWDSENNAILNMPEVTRIKEYLCETEEIIYV